MYHKKLILTLTILAFIFINVGMLNAQTLYKASLVRAAPGELLELIDIYKKKAIELENKTGFKPYILRHSQGDSWDLMIVQFVKDYSYHFNSDLSTSSQFVPAFSEESTELIAYHEEMFFDGPEFEILKSEFESNNYFHVEMFISLSGKHAELLAERKMENKYLELIERPENFIFTRDMGGKWDIFTIGAYRDLTHYAESALIPEENEEKAAIQAGFESVGTIGSYLRSLILEHHDTLATKVN
jgi:hypothetical protein